MLFLLIWKSLKASTLQVQVLVEIHSPDNTNLKRKTSFLFNAIVHAAAASNCMVVPSTLLLKIQMKSLWFGFSVKGIRQKEMVAAKSGIKATALLTSDRWSGRRRPELRRSCVTIIILFPYICLSTGDLPLRIWCPPPRKSKEENIVLIFSLQFFSNCKQHWKSKRYISTYIYL